MNANGGIAQLARATGSYPVGHGFKSNSRYHRPVGQAAKTPPFHGGNGSSILPRVTINKRGIAQVQYLFCLLVICTELNSANFRLRKFVRTCAYCVYAFLLHKRAGLSSDSPTDENRSAMQALLALPEFAFCEQGDGSSLTRAASKNIRATHEILPVPLSFKQPRATISCSRFPFIRLLQTFRHPVHYSSLGRLCQQPLPSRPNPPRRYRNKGSP